MGFLDIFKKKPVIPIQKEEVYTRPVITGKDLPKELEPVFISGGVQYYKYVNEQNLRAMRALSALDIYDEMNWKVDLPYLLDYVSATRAAYNSGNYTDAGVLLHYLEQRLTHITHPDLYYKLASVVFVDDSEDLRFYDPVYADKKIDQWKKDKELDDFFLNTRLKELIPFLNTSGLSFRQYLRSQNLELIEILEYTLSVLSKRGGSQEKLNSLTSKIQKLRDQLPYMN
jgi:hypothetical protein